MQALVLTEYRKLELQPLERPSIGPEDVLVAVRACGICGSDVHGYDGSTGRRVPPIVMGHEAAGVIEDVGQSVAHFGPGDRVTFDSTLYCGRCAACSAGQVNLCPDRRVFGVSCAEYRQQGAFAQYVVVPQRIIHPLPPELPMEHAALIEPLSVAMHAVDRLDTVPNETAVVVGGGMIGLLVLQVLRTVACCEVVVIEPDRTRRQLARELGAASAIDPGAGDAVATVMERTGGRGADVVVECVGNASALATAIDCVGRGGRVGLVGNLAAETPFPLQSVVTREITLVGSCASAGEYPRAIELLADGAIHVAPLISAVAPLAEGPKWFERLYAREPGLMKVILQP